MTQTSQPYELYRDLILTLLGLGIAFWFYRLDWLLIAGGGVSILGLASKLVRTGNHFLWQKITQIMQWTIQPAIGAIVFFLILTPIGLLFQFFRKNKKLDSSAFIDVDREFDASFFDKQW